MQNPVTKQRLVYDMPGTGDVVVRRDVEFRAADGGVLAMDLYSPPDSRSDARTPAVVIVAGFPDVGFQARLGCRFKDMESSVSWARLLAASGMVAITYSNREPAADLDALLAHIGSNAAALGIEENRIGLWASSGHGPLALSVLTRVKCAALCNPYMLDLDGATGVAEVSKLFGFVNPNAGKTVQEVPKDVPLFVVRSGQDKTPRLNETLDRFIAGALACNLPLSFVNHPGAPHAFDLFHDSETSREIIAGLLTFMRFHLLKESAS
jgi:hypothetical protein